MKKVILVIILFFSFSFAKKSFAQKFTISIEIQNIYDTPLKIKFKKGDIYETENPDSNTQNLVLANDYTFTLAPYEIKPIILKAFCTNQSRLLPNDGAAVRPTELRRNDADEWNSYNDLWDKMENRKQEIQSQR